MSNYLIVQETRECRACHRPKRVPQDFYTNGLNGRGVMRYKTTCKACMNAYALRYQATKAAEHVAKARRRPTSDPAILLYRAEKKKAAPRLERRARQIEVQARRLMEQMAVTAGSFHVGRTPAVDIYPERRFA